MSSRKLLVALLSLTLAAATGPAQKDSDSRPTAPPAGPPAPVRLPPEFTTVSKVDTDKGILQLRKTGTVTQAREVTETVQREGRSVQQTRTVIEQVPVVQMLEVDLKQFRFINGRGDKVDNKKALGKLEEGKVLLLCWDINGVEEKVLKLLAEDALILMPRDAGKPAPKREEPRREDRSDR